MKIRLGDPILQPLSDAQIESLDRRELIVIAKGEQLIRAEYEKFIAELQERYEAKQRLAEEMTERVMLIHGTLCRIRSRVFGKKSERSKKNNDKPKNDDTTSGSSPKAKVTKLPSERYPNAKIIEKDITLEQPPTCHCCQATMKDSGMVETSEHLTVTPKKYVIIRENRHKYRCNQCHSNIVTTPPLPRVVPGGSYSDELITDATLSKYCDLIPMERYCQMAKRQGFEGLPPHSLISGTFRLADFMSKVYELIKLETLTTKVLLADETPHRMLEGDEKSNWYLWGFSSERSCFYECHDTRSGTVASTVFLQSTCTTLLTDLYRGYHKAVRETNAIREEKKLPLIAMAYCNSHARRQFKEVEEYPEAAYMVEQYRDIYALNAMAAKIPQKIAEYRNRMRPYFEAMLTYCKSARDRFSEKSTIAKAIGYFVDNYEGLTVFLTNHAVPIDNNASERLLRSYVVGRKTWYGTHSRDGANAAAIHFTIVESCKLNGINPREYYREMIRRIHAGEAIATPREICDSTDGSDPPQSH